MISWTDTGCEIGGVRFDLVTSDFAKHQSNRDRLVVLKGRPMVESYVKRLTDVHPKRVLELGIYEGGSPVMLSLLFGIEHLVGIDLRQNIPGFDAWRTAHPDIAPGISTYYGTSQDDRAALERIIAAEFQGEPIDLIIDDASHFFAESRAAFEITFPYLRPGGLYIIEDWGWAHWGGTWQSEKTWIDKRPLSLLIFELTMLAASRSDFIASVHIETPSLAVITKGSIHPPQPFRLDDHIMKQGRPLKFL